MPTDHYLLMNVYNAFNARDVDTVLAAMGADVEWPRGAHAKTKRGPSL